MSEQERPERTLVMLDRAELRVLGELVKERRENVAGTNADTDRLLNDLSATLRRSRMPLDELSKDEPQYPQSELLSARFVEWQHIDAFLDYLAEQGLYLARETDNGILVNDYTSRNRMRDEYLGINSREHDNELRAMLDEMRAANERKSNAS